LNPNVATTHRENIRRSIAGDFAGTRSVRASAKEHIAIGFSKKQSYYE
jgi:hypothetical protein